MQNLCRQQQERIKQLDAVDKENVGNNSVKSSESGAVIVNEKLEMLMADYEVLKKKYDITRRLCTLRNDDIAKHKAEFALLYERHAHLNEKYEKVKEICDLRLTKLQELRGRLAPDEKSPPQ